MSEKELQLEIHRWRNLHCPIVPNSHCFGYESDLLSVTQAGFSIDHEIKCNKADFKAEMRQANEAKASKKRNNRANAKYQKHFYLNAALERKPNPRYCPNYFTFVCPVGIIEVKDLPDYAGLVYYDPNHWERLEVIVKAPRLHSTKISARQLAQLTRGLNFRFWRLHRKENGIEDNEQ